MSCLLPCVTCSVHTTNSIYQPGEGNYQLVGQKFKFWVRKRCFFNHQIIFFYKNTTTNTSNFNSRYIWANRIGSNKTNIYPVINPAHPLDNNSIIYWRKASNPSLIQRMSFWIFSIKPLKNQGLFFRESLRGRKREDSYISMRRKFFGTKNGQKILKTFFLSFSSLAFLLWSL